MRIINSTYTQRDQQLNILLSELNVDVSTNATVSFANARPSLLCLTTRLDEILTKSSEVLDVGHTIRFGFLSDADLISELVRRVTLTVSGGF